MEEVTIRKATLSDALDIQRILNVYAAEEKLLPRSIADIHENIQSFFVAEIDGRFVGCSCLHPYYPFLGEVRSLAVEKEHTNKGIGTILVKTCLEEAKKLGMKEAFTLTYVPEFFEKLGFKLLSKEKLHPKIWADCMRCHKYPDCDEKALKIAIK
jgi:amino-acid N-acetyltransferase